MIVADSSALCVVVEFWQWLTDNRFSRDEAIAPPSKCCAAAALTSTARRGGAGDRCERAARLNL
jgi:hypothetical protein